MKAFIIFIVFPFSFFAQQSDSIVFILFETNSFQIHSSYGSTINLDTTIWVRTIQLKASTDTVGKVEYNKWLSNKRLESVQCWIKKQSYFSFTHNSSVGELYKTDQNYSNSKFRTVQITLQRKIIPKPKSNKTVVFTESDTDLYPGKKLVLKNIEFVLNESTILPSSYKELGKLVAFLKAHPELRIQIRGHVCCAPAVGLSKQRAKRIYDYLIKKGIDASRMTYQGFSNTIQSELSTDPNSSEQRRVEIEILE